MKKLFGFIALFVLLCAGVYAAGNKNDLAYLGYDELQAVDGLTAADSVIVIESNVPKKGSTVANVLALASPSDIENANGDLTVTRDAIITRDVVGTGVGEIRGMLTDNEVGVTTDTLEVAETGRVNIVTTASTKTLPAVANGLEYTFMSGAAVEITVDPAAADTIKVASLSLDAGDKAVTSAATGQTITLYGTSTANTWYATCYPAACTDGGA